MIASNSIFLAAHLWIMRRLSTSIAGRMLGVLVLNQAGERLDWRQLLLRDATYCFSSFFSAVDLLLQFSGPEPVLKPQNWAGFGDYLLQHETIFGKAGWLAIVVYLGDLASIVFHREHRSLHDLLAGTYVLRTKVCKVLPVEENPVKFL